MRIQNSDVFAPPLVQNQCVSKIRQDSSKFWICVSKIPLVPLQIHVFSHINVTCVSKTRIQNRKKRIQNMYFAYPKLNVRASKNRIHNFVNVSKNQASRIQTYPKLAYPKCPYPKNRIQTSYPKCVSKMKHLKCANA